MLLFLPLCPVSGHAGPLLSLPQSRHPLLTWLTDFLGMREWKGGGSVGCAQGLGCREAPSWRCPKASREPSHIASFPIKSLHLQ